jgi:predicted nucleic acid-binding protein
VARNVYFDTSIFVQMAARRSKHAKNIRLLMKELKTEKARIYTSILTVQELSVATHRRGAIARDIHGDILKIAKIITMTKEIALTAGKREAELKDLAGFAEEKPEKKHESEEEKLERICENRRRKWDCFHIATAQLHNCGTVYSTDRDLKKRPGQLSLKNIKIIDPEPSAENYEIDFDAAAEQAKGASKNHERQADPTHSTAIQGSDRGRAEGETSRQKGEEGKD